MITAHRRRFIAALSALDKLKFRLCVDGSALRPIDDATDPTSARVVRLVTRKWTAANIYRTLRARRSLHETRPSRSSSVKCRRLGSILREGPAIFAQKKTGKKKRKPCRRRAFCSAHSCCSAFAEVTTAACATARTCARKSILGCSSATDRSVNNPVRTRPRRAILKYFFRIVLSLKLFSL